MNTKILKRLLSISVMGMSMMVTTQAYAGPFDKGRKNISVVVGSGAAFNENYTVVGVGFDYLVQDGLQLGIDAQAWLGGEPSIYKFSPQAGYVFNRNAPLKPYVGAFYRQTVIENLENLASAGYRVGAYFNKGAGYQMAVGYVFESYLDCNETIFNECSDSYPELVFTFSL